MLLGSNKNNIIFMKRLVLTLILFMLFIIPINAKAEIKCKRGMDIHYSTSTIKKDIYEFGYLKNSTQGYNFGDAFTCDVNGDGIFDERNERFYYINDYYDTDELKFNEDYAVLLFYSPTDNSGQSTQGRISTVNYLLNGDNLRKSTKYGTTDDYHYNLTGPGESLMARMPSEESWSNVSLLKTERQILDSYNRTLYHNNNNTETYHYTKIDYSGHAARLLTFQELEKYLTPDSTTERKYSISTYSSFVGENPGMIFDDDYHEFTGKAYAFHLEGYSFPEDENNVPYNFTSQNGIKNYNFNSYLDIDGLGYGYVGPTIEYTNISARPAIEVAKSDISLIGRNTYLSSISIDGVPLENFNKFTTYYNLSQEIGTSISSIDAVAEDDLSTVTISNSSNITSNYATTKNVEITVTSESGDTRVYRLNIKFVDYGTYLRNLDIQDYGLNETFERTKINYSVNLPSTATSINIIATPEHSNTVVTGAGTISVTGTGLTQDIILTSSDGHVRTYTIDITREIDKNLNISQINVTNGSLTTEFDNETNEYTIKVEDDNVNLNVVPESTFTTVSGDGNITLDENTPVTVTLTAENGDTRVLTFHIRESIRVEKDSYLIDKGKTDTIVFTSNIASSDLKYEIEDTEVADLDGLTINAKDIGTTTIKISRISDPTIYKIITVGVEGGNLESILYSIYNKNEEQIISGIKTNTTVKDFKDNLLNPNEHLKVYNNEELLNDTDLVKTGFTVKLVVDGKELDSAIIIIIGDINQDGIINIEDEAMLFDHVNLNKELTTYQMYAADVSNDYLVDQNDITKLHDYLLLRNIDINKNKVIIDPNGGVYNENSEVQEIIENEETTEIGIPTKEGYTFNGWKLIGGGEITNNSPVDTINQTYTFGDYNGKLKATYIAPKNIKAYDVFGTENYTLSNNQIQVYNGNGIDGKISLDIELDKDDIIEYTYSVSMRTGGGFSINDGETILYNKSVSGPSSGSNSGDGSYTYEESKKILKFYFSGNGGSFNIKIKSKNGATYLLRSNSVAVGYSTNGGTISEGGCTGTTICSLRQVGETYGTLPTISKTGYTFNGWYQNSDFSGDKVTESTIVSKTTSHNLYAKFTINSYTLTINANGGTYSGTNPIIQNYNTTATISKPTRSNYLFNGWSKSGAGSITNNESANQTFTFGAGNSTITANWMSNKKTVSGSNLNASSISGSTVSSSACTSNPNAQLTLLPGESVTYYVVGSSGSMGGGGGSFMVDNDTKCSTSSSNSCSGTWKNTTSSNQTIKVGIGCSNATASFSLSDVKTRFGETYTLSK